MTTEWLARNLRSPGLVVVESDEDVLLYDTGHVPGSVRNYDGPWTEWGNAVRVPIAKGEEPGEVRGGPRGGR